MILIECLYRRRLADDTSKLGPHSTSLQQSKILERSNSLRRKIEAWITVQHLYMPAVAAQRIRNDSLATSPVAVQDIELFLPSSSPSILAISSANLVKSEWEYRIAQAKETLDLLRGYLMVQSHMYRSKDCHSRGQRQQTRSLRLLSDVQAKITYSTKSYRFTYDVLKLLSMRVIDPSWQNQLRPLLDSDIVGLSSMDNMGGSEGRRRLSWIWKAEGTGANGNDCTEASMSTFFQS